MALVPPALNRASTVAPLGGLHDRPGFLFRRAHQIAVGVFDRHCAQLGLTAPQHSSLLAISRFPGLNQAELGRVIGFDRATMGQILAGLAERELVSRASSGPAGRTRAITLTPKGHKFLRYAALCSAKTSEDLLAPFSPTERQSLIRLLKRLVLEHNLGSRTPIQAPSGHEPFPPFPQANVGKAAHDTIPVPDPDHRSAD